MKKIYDCPATRVFEIGASGVICGSGDLNARVRWDGLSSTSASLQPLSNSNGDIVPETETYRSNLWGD